jgi:hypothetical protein
MGLHPLGQARAHLSADGVDLVIMGGHLVVAAGKGLVHYVVQDTFKDLVIHHGVPFWRYFPAAQLSIVHPPLSERERSTLHRTS